MSTPQSPSAIRTRPKSRKSIAHPGILNEKENFTIDSADISGMNAHAKSGPKKSRSKSIGPGGLDALKEDAGNRREIAWTPQVKSILKPTIPLSPPKQIPPRSSVQKTSPSKTRSKKSPQKQAQDSSLIEGATSTGVETHGLPNPFGGSLEPANVESQSQSPLLQETRIAVRTEDEQQAAAKERERRELIERRDARRKSLANRRVSFAPEATLHTWDVVELPEDSTTSSASTRRASALSASANSPFPQPQIHFPSSDASEPPSTPPEQAEEIQVTASPAHQRDLHQKKRRRSSGIPPMNFNNPDDFSSSPSGGSVNSDDASVHSFVTADDDGESSSSGDHDLVEESTVTGIDAEDVTSHSEVSAHSSVASSTGSSHRLEAALQQAANQAGTQGIEYDEHGDITMDMADEEITAAFKPWMKNGVYTPQVIGNPSALHDQENLNPFSPAFKADITGNITQNDQERTMEFTQAAGKILQSNEDHRGSPSRGRRQSGIIGRRRSSSVRRRSSGDGSELQDETMDLTTAIGSIQPRQKADERLEEAAGYSDEDEELTMEFTTVVGGVLERENATKVLEQDASLDGRLAHQQLHPEEVQRESGSLMDNEETMDMTMMDGGILSSITERTEPAEDQTMGMEITAAIGAILPEQLSTRNKTEAKLLMEHETDVGQLSGSPFYSQPVNREPDGQILNAQGLSSRANTIASETGSPSLASSHNRSNPRKSVSLRKSTTPKPGSHQSTPIKKPMTPSKQMTPQPPRPTTPGKTPPLNSVTLRTGSPKKLFKSEIKHAASTPKLSLPASLFQRNIESGAATPSIILKPRRRRSSGLGIDKEGLGSPRVTELLDRRGSIGDIAKTFTPQGQASMGVRFEDPQVMEQELEVERAEDQRRESGRGILQMEADISGVEAEKDATVNLKEMILSLTPQKKKLNGRKSLHVGAAKGLLGKRPAELDDDEDEETPPKRLKGREASPVKNVRLRGPPSKTETTGRITRSTRGNLVETVGNAQVSTPSMNLSPVKLGNVTTPKDQTRFKDAELQSSATKPPISFEEKLHNDIHVVDEPADEDSDRVHLQDFLNMTSIRFMELTTTKRRHTVAPNNFLENSTQNVDVGGQNADQAQSGRELEDCVVAGACTVPMLELYQHSCRELKKYISEGRSIVREIEADTFEENPPLFREYMSAAPDVRSIMDNQFKNVKTHARLLSKAMWYEWRMKLLDGLKEGLLGVGEGMEQDAENLTQQELLLEPVLPGLVQEHGQLEDECRLLQAQADEMASCDQEELKDAREELAMIEEEIEAKQKMITDLQQQLSEKEYGIENNAHRKQDCLEEIKVAEKVRQDCRGWSAPEVAALKAKVDALEQSHGWNIASATGATLTMTYRRTLQLFFTPSSFQPPVSDPPATTENAPISLTYIADTHLHHPQPLTTTKRFFLQIIRAHLQCLPQSQTPIPGLLAFVARAWGNACSTAEEARELGTAFITDVRIVRDEVLAVESCVLVREVKAKVEVGFEVEVGGGGMEVRVKVKGKVVYGDLRVGEGGVGGCVEERVKSGVGWVAAVRVLEAKLGRMARK